MTPPNFSRSNAAHGWRTMAWEKAHLPHRVSPTMMSLQMGMMQAMWQHLPDALRKASDGSLNWKPSLKAEGRALQKRMRPRDGQAVPQEAMERACRLEILNRLEGFLQGVLAYQAWHRHRDAWFDTPPQTVWRRGAASLLYYGKGTDKEGAAQEDALPMDVLFSSGAEKTRKKKPVEKGAPVLFVPSLINRSYILDLYPGHSFLRYLAAQGREVYLLDWGEPEEEPEFGIDAYIEQRLVPAVYHLAQESGQPVVLAGYCMGGNMALGALPLLHKNSVKALALFATPWDFHADEESVVKLDEASIAMLEAIIEREGHVPAWFLQPMFYRSDAWLFLRKFQMFSAMEDSRERDACLALEYWLNDGVPLTRQVARDCLIGWAHENRMATRRWQVGGVTVTPELAKHLPVFCAVPQRDRVVPPRSTQSVLAALQHATVVRPDVGHVKMVMGVEAREYLWEPFNAWLAGL